MTDPLKTSSNAPYRPFANLMHHISSVAPAPAESDNSTVSINFIDAVGEVRRLKHDKNIRRPLRKHRTKRAADSTDRSLDTMLVKGPTGDIVNTTEYIEGYCEDMHPMVMDKLRSGEFSVEQCLDLHGYSIADSSFLFSDFIEKAVKDGIHCVKVIHGRGLKSKGDPVLKKNLTSWIIRAMNRKWVIAFATARQRDGGAGATYILLRTRPKKKKIRIVG